MNTKTIYGVVSDYYEIRMEMGSCIHELAYHEDNGVLLSELTLEARSICDENPFELLEEVLPFMHKTFPGYLLKATRAEGKKFVVTYTANAMVLYKTLDDLLNEELAVKNDVLNTFIWANLLGDAKLTGVVDASMY